MASSSNPAEVFDRNLVRVRRARAAAGFAEADFLKRRVVTDLADRLEAIKRDFPVAYDLGSHGGYFREEVLQRKSLAQRIGIVLESDFSEAMLKRATSRGASFVADEENLPIAPASLDLVVSAISLHWVNDLPGCFAQVRRALKPDGLFIASLIGGRSLADLRAAFLEAESELRGGAGPRLSPFADVQDVAGLLQRAGFALPVADTDTIEVRYRDPFKILRDLRLMGEGSALKDKTGAPLTRAILMRAMEIYANKTRDGDGRYVAKFDIVTATGWAPSETQQKPLRPGSAKMRLADALGAVEHKL
jgi:SAM-dependent methyltransferase